MKRSLRHVVATLLWITPLLVSPARATAEDWPRWRGPRGDGTWNGPALPDAWPQDGLAVRWRTKIGGGYAGIVVDAGRVYTMDRQEEPTEVERVLCFDAADGRLLWHHDYPVTYGDLSYGNGPRAAPTVAEGRVYTLGAMGDVCCLDAKDGRPIWTHNAVREQEAKLPEWGLAASPVRWKHLLITHTGAGEGRCLSAYDASSGRPVWNRGDDPAGYATPIVIQHQGESLLVAWTPLHILGVDPLTGRIHWRIPYEVTYGVSIATPIYHNDTILVTGYWEGTKAIRLGDTPREASLLWEEGRVLRGLMSQPLVREGYVYSIDKRFGLTCFELATGRKLWDAGNRMTPRGRNPQATMVWTGNQDRVLVLNSEGELILARFNPNGYTELARTGIIGATWAHPAYAGQHVYARDDKELVCVSLNEAAPSP